MGDVAAARKICARIKRSRGAAISATFSEEALRDTPRGQARTDADLEEWVYQSWLDTDLSTTHPIPTLPSTGAAATTLDRAVVVQIDAVLDVSRAAYDQLAVIRGDRDKSNQWERSRHGGAEPASSKRVLKLKLTDGVSAVIGYEIQTVPWLRTHTMPGSKVCPGAPACNHAPPDHYPTPSPTPLPAHLNTTCTVLNHRTTEPPQQHTHLTPVSRLPSDQTACRSVNPKWWSVAHTKQLRGRKTVGGDGCRSVQAV